MDHPIDQRTWWDLHLRKARGETLTDQEQEVYEAELARQDRDAPPLNRDLEALKTMREQVLALGRNGAELRRRVAELETRIGSSMMMASCGCDSHA